MKKFLLLILLLLTPSLLSCVDTLEDYYEVHSVVIDGVIYRYIDPSDGKSTFRRGDMNSVGTYFLYIYHKEEGETFSYDKFFMPAYDRFVETSMKDKLQYTLANDDIDQWIYQYWLDYEFWKEENKKE
ncbi:MAG: hypothetical protein PHP65_05390 [Bacilli bacterium]|nr:hypothetical protein [Bacilli bacterium]